MNSSGWSNREERFLSFLLLLFFFCRQLNSLRIYWANCSFSFKYWHLDPLWLACSKSILFCHLRTTHFFLLQLVIPFYTLCPSCCLCGSFLRYFDKFPWHSNVCIIIPVFLLELWENKFCTSWCSYHILFLKILWRDIIIPYPS